MIETRLHQYEDLPDGFLDCPGSDLHQILQGPSLIHLEGQQNPAIFVSILLHGDELTGLLAVQRFLKDFFKPNRKLPRSLSLFVGNVLAAKFNCRKVADQPDYNRIWKGGETPDHHVAIELLEEMKRRGVFASVDVHNNSGANPLYSCVNRLDADCLNLALTFQKQVVYFTKPDTVLSNAFSQFCPATVLECGKSAEASGINAVYDFLHQVIDWKDIASDMPKPQDYHLLKSEARIIVPDHLKITFADTRKEEDICFIPKIDKLNFQRVEAGTILGYYKASGQGHLQVWDLDGNERGDDFFAYEHGVLKTKQAFVPAMFTEDQSIIFQDCFGYIMHPMTL